VAESELVFLDYRDFQPEIFEAILVQFENTKQNIERSCPVSSGGNNTVLGL
jgi:hypothetical protein